MKTPVDDRRYWLDREKGLAAVHRVLQAELKTAEADGAEDLAAAINGALWCLGGAIMQAGALQTRQMTLQS